MSDAESRKETPHPATEQMGYGDVNYCPNCGEEVPDSAQSLTEDLVLNRYRTQFKCVECWYHGELFRHDGGDQD